MAIRLLVLAIVLVPALAEACPACLGQQRGWTATLELLGVMLLVPFAVAGVVARAIRRADDER